MGPTNREQTAALMRRLAEAPEDFDFFRAVSLLAAAHPDAPPVGCADSPDQEFVRFGQLPSLSFPSRTLERFVPGRAGEPARLYVGFFGFFGPNGVLPLWVTEHAIECQRLARRRDVSPGGMGESDLTDPSVLARLLVRGDVPFIAWLRSRLDPAFLAYLEMVSAGRFQEDESRQRLVAAINQVLADPALEADAVQAGLWDGVGDGGTEDSGLVSADQAWRLRNRHFLRQALNEAGKGELILAPDPRTGMDSSFVEFLNLIQHRFYALFYRAWAIHQLEPASFHANLPFERQHPAVRVLASLAGMGTASLWRTGGFDPDEVFRYLGFLPARSRSAAMLEALLSDCLGVPVVIRQFMGRWIRLPEADQGRLGDDFPRSVLGEGAILGGEVFSADMAFRVEVGPLDFDAYQQLLPGRPEFLRLHRWVELMVNRELAWDLRLILRRDKIPPCRFPKDDGSPDDVPTALGWTSWLPDQGREEDAADFLHDPEQEGLGVPVPA